MKRNTIRFHHFNEKIDATLILKPTGFALEHKFQGQHLKKTK